MSKANSIAIQVVENYVGRLQRQPYPYWRSLDFAYQSYSKSAAIDILNILKKDATTPPLILIEEYKDLMDRYSCESKRSSFMFSVAYDTADDIIDELINTFA